MPEFEDFVRYIGELVDKYGVELDHCAWIEIKKKLSTHPDVKAEGATKEG